MREIRTWRRLRDLRRISTHLKLSHKRVCVCVCVCVVNLLNYRPTFLLFFCLRKSHLHTETTADFQPSCLHSHTIEYDILVYCCIPLGTPMHLLGFFFLCTTDRTCIAGHLYKLKKTFPNFPNCQGNSIVYLEHGIICLTLELYV